MARVHLCQGQRSVRIGKHNHAPISQLQGLFQPRCEQLLLEQILIGTIGDGPLKACVDCFC